MGASHFLVKLQCFTFLWLWLQVGSAEIQTIALRPITKPGCRDRCGNVSIPYPFGIGDGCSLGGYFELTCDDSYFGSSLPTYEDYNFSKISIPDGHITALLWVSMDCSDEKMPGWTTFNHFSPFTLSNTKNKFIAMDYDTYAFLQLGDKRDNTALGCTSVCDTMEDISDGSCTGFGCCAASIPPGIGSYNITVRSVGETRRNLSFNPCSYAFLIEESSFQFSKSYLQNFLNNGNGVVPVVVDWTIGNETCEIAKTNLTSYACGPNTICTSSNVSSGYRCNCKKGYEGNPYLNSSTGGECQEKYDPKCDPYKVRDGCLAPPPIIINESFPRSKFNQIVAGAFLSLSLLLVTSFILGI
ncbi:hypothetical protein MKW92_038579 [Papaver armeniacum]|nr:hypothetical protein MKW92_038579 [Papaver armeniacum]